jgi:hypothetical protein
MKLPLSIAKKLLQMMEGQKVPSSSMQHAIVEKMIDDGVVQWVQNKSRRVLFIGNIEAAKSYLKNQFAINNLRLYVERFSDDDLARSEAVELSGNSKLKSIRTFKGFLVNSYSPVEATLAQQSSFINPQPGTCTFIADYASFSPAENVTVVGVENPENFFHIQQQQHLFQHIHPLFVCRYPQGNDLVKWLDSIPNNYVHFGDFDFEGINIYLREYKKYLKERAIFFIPGNVEDMIARFGNRDLYNKQISHAPLPEAIEEQAIVGLLALFHKHRKVLEQEIFIRK